MLYEKTQCRLSRGDDQVGLSLGISVSKELFLPQLLGFTSKSRYIQEFAVELDSAGWIRCKRFANGVVNDHVCRQQSFI